MDNCSVFTKFVLLLMLLVKLALASGYITTTTDKLSFRSKNLKNVPSDLIPRENADIVTQAKFSHNSFDELKTTDFIHLAQYPNIKYVFFDHNNISRVESDTFTKVPSLKHLDLSHNKLSEIPNELYDDLAALKFLRYVNLKRNPIKNYKNIDKLTARGVQVEYDGVLGREKMLRVRNRRVVSDGSSSNVHEEDAKSYEEEEEEEEIAHSENSDDELDDKVNSTRLHDKPVKAFVIDHKISKTDRVDTDNFKINSNFLGSIIFNFLAAFLVLVALPISMVVYYFIHRKDGIS